MHMYNNLLAIIELLQKDNWKGKEQDELIGESEIKLLCDGICILCKKWYSRFPRIRELQPKQANVNGTAHTPIAV